MIRIINAGIFTTIQDLGRHGYQNKGVAVSGAMDKLALIFGNMLNANDKDMAGLEITYSGFKCEFMTDTTIALTGADLAYNLNGKKISMNESIFINKGDVLEAQSLIKGVRGYLTVLGGIDVDKVLDSRSTYIKGKFGGYYGRKLKNQDQIKINVSKQYPLKVKRKIPNKLLDEIYRNRKLKVILGPEDYSFSKNAIETFLSSEYTIGLESDRMGYRLSGRKIEHKTSADILSAPLTFGSIQVPGSGQPIVMMADRQTTGGYTKIAHIISMDHSYLSQLKSDEKVSFEEISVEDSQQILRKYMKKISDLEYGFENDRDFEKEIRRFRVSLNNKEFNVKVASVD